MTALAALPTEPVDPGWGKDYQHGKPAYMTPGGLVVWMRRKGIRFRFYDSAGNQVGPEHAHLAAAVCWAAAHAWIDPSAPLLSLAVISEVRNNSRRRGLPKGEEGAWEPHRVAS